MLILAKGRKNNVFSNDLSLCIYEYMFSRNPLFFFSFFVTRVLNASPSANRPSWVIGLFVKAFSAHSTWNQPICALSASKFCAEYNVRPDKSLFSGFCWRPTSRYPVLSLDGDQQKSPIIPPPEREPLVFNEVRFLAGYDIKLIGFRLLQNFPRVIWRPYTRTSSV